MMILLLFPTILLTVSPTLANNYVNLGPCNPYKDPTNIKDNLCIHIIETQQTRQEAEKTCKSVSARLPDEHDVEAVYKRLFWFYENPGSWIFFFADTNAPNAKRTDTEAIGYNMSSIDNRDFAYGKNVKNNVVCIRERIPKLTCPPDFTFVESIPACFHHDWSVKRNFWECRAYCKSKGGYPIVFDSFEQFMWLFQNFFTRKYYPKNEDGCWSGHFIPNAYEGTGSREYMRANEYAIDGSTPSKDPNLWKMNEPNAGGKTGEREHCIEFFPTRSAFNDYFCHYTIAECACRAIPDQTQALYN